MDVCQQDCKCADKNVSLKHISKTKRSKKKNIISGISTKKNQNAAAFLTKLIGNLYRNNEALGHRRKRRVYVADSFSKEEKALLQI